MSCYFSIIVPVYNNQDYLDRCIQSIIKQTINNYELILIDDGSTDKSPTICDDYSKKYSNIFTYHINNSGVSTARNIGIEKAKGQYILFLDSDDWIERDTLKKLLTFLEDNDVDIVKFLKVKEVGKVSIYDKKLFNHLEVLNKKEFYKIYKISFNTYYFNNLFCMVFKSNLVKKLKLDSNLGYGEDFLFNLAALEMAKKIGFYNEYFYHYIINANSATSCKNLDKQRKNLIDCIKVYTKIFDYLKYLNVDYDYYEEILKNRFYKELDNCFFHIIKCCNYDTYYQILREFTINCEKYFDLNIFDDKDINRFLNKRKCYKYYFLINIKILVKKFLKSLRYLIKMEIR